MKMDSIGTSQISKSAMQHMSESAFVKLCRQFGTSQQVALRRDMKDIQEMVETEISGDVIVVRRSGSYGEGFILHESDFDIMHWPNDHRVIWELSQSQCYNIHRKRLILCDSSESPPGYTLLCLLSPSIGRRFQRACFRMNNKHYISSSKFRQLMCSASPFNATPHGPCASGTYGILEFDEAQCFACDFWPPSASSWIDRCRDYSWPQSHIVNDIVNVGCHFVAIGHKLGNHEDHEWRISFCLAEHKLVYTMNHCQFLTYGLLKLFLTEIINEGLSDDDKLLCSYHMKTAVFWVIQQNIIPHWCPQNLLECFWVCFKLVLKWVYEGVCPNFFIPANNMFLSKIHGEAQKSLFIKLHELYEKGLAFLEQSPSIWSCIINVLQNPRLDICTDEQALISEIAFDVHLTIELFKQDKPSMLNVERFLKYLPIIEKMIGSPLITQYQVIMLQIITASVLQSLAFLLHVKTNSCKNKLKYKADKISCHMLKLAAKFGCISDMLYIAMYYYKTFRYQEALSILEVTKVKLTQPYVMYNAKVDAELYTEAVGGQSWSTKMRKAVAWDIKLDNKICHINELELERQSCLDHNEPVLILSPFILLHMLEILCYRHVDTMRAQTALNDLHTLVKSVQRQLRTIHLRQISWQILGICQEMTGNPQDALYSYQQSRKQIPLIKIQTATEMRIQGLR